jgi:N-methylhydantoinase A
MEPPRTSVAGIDVGGTFTDVVLVEGSAPVRARKVPTTPDDQGEGVTDGLDAAAGEHVGQVAHGTTTATNAVLERAVARTVLVTTQGFGDVLAIARQDRPRLYDLAAVRPPHLVGAGDVVTVAERIGPDGETVVPLSDAEVVRVADAVVARDPEAVAICLLFAFADGRHEWRLAEALRERLEVPITCSADLVCEFREYERASTVVLNAAVAPVMGHYLGRLEARLEGSRVTVMTSGGGTAGLREAARAPIHTLLSGPAAGVVAAAATARSAGFSDAVAFDMGGTSTDVCLIRDGRPQLHSAAEIGGLPFRTPAVAIHTVGAGGGSLAFLDPGGALRVGPQSAGARPGPACYGLGGTEPTVTDAHCALGHLAPDGSLGGGALRLDVDAAQRALERLPRDVAGTLGVAHGILTVARATMVRALRRVTTEQGVDPAGLAVVAYGGAGPLHATALARELGAAAVVVPPAPGVLSALGLLLAPSRAESARTVMVRVEAGADPPELDAVWEQLAGDAAATLREQGVESPALARVADCRYAGQSHELRVADDGSGLAAAFHLAHREAYGYALAGEAVELVTLRVVADGEPALAKLPDAWDHGGGEVRPAGQRRLGSGSDAVTALVVDRAGLRSGDDVTGPAIVEQPDATTLLSDGDVATVDAAGNLVVRCPVAD